MAKAMAAQAREEIRAAERHALLARKRLEATEEKRREAINRATVTVAAAGPVRQAAPPASAQHRAVPVQEPVQPRPEQRWGNAAAAMGGSRGRCYYCGLPGVFTDFNYPNVALYDKARP